MAFAHQYTHAGTAAAALQGSQVMLSTKASHSPTSPSNIEQTRALIHESGLPLLHFLPRMPGLPDVYGQGPLTPTSLGVEPSAFYPMGGPPGHLPGSPEQWKGLPGQTPVVYPFDPMMAVHPYASFYGGLDLNNAARRKNATRETTSALKAWLYEHRKNPYPTKGEKIMLAIITKMTLTQVSTWFANARRRLKKESKSGWNGKDRDLDDSDFETDGDDKSNHNQDKTDYSILKSGTESDDEDIDIKVTSDISDISDNEFDQSEEDKTRTGSRLSMTPESSTYSIESHSFERNHVSSVIKPEHSSSSISCTEKSEHSSDGASSNVNTEQSNINEVRRNSVVVSPNTKPKIWSIVEIMNKDITPKSKVTTNLHPSHNHREVDDNSFRTNSLEHITTSMHNGTVSNKTILKTRTETIVSPKDNQNNS